jgi:hypothetical protein
MRVGWKIVLGLTIAAGAALAALPFWLGHALPLIGKPLHLTFGRYERQGYGRFALHDTVFQRNNVKVTVQYAEYDTPLLWAWRHLRHEDHPAHARGWEVTVTASTLPPTGPRKVTGITTLHPLLEKIGTNLGRWLPHAEVQNGAVHWPERRLERKYPDDRGPELDGRLGRRQGCVPAGRPDPGGRARAGPRMDRVGRLDRSRSGGARHGVGAASVRHRPLWSHRLDA